MTDLVFSVLLVFFIWRGATRGFLQSIIGPLSFVAATVLAYSLYTITRNIFIALSVGLFGPFILHWVLRALIMSFGEIKKPSVTSRVLGALMTAIWGGLILLPIVFILTFMPPMLPSIASMTEDIGHSCAFKVARPIAQLFKIPGSIPAASNTKAAKTPPSSSISILAEDAQMQAIMNDPALVKAIENKDFATLLADPKIQAIAKDPALMQKILAAAKEIPPVK